jgi:hypothetical protein
MGQVGDVGLLEGLGRVSNYVPNRLGIPPVPKLIHTTERGPIARPFKIRVTSE